MKKLIITTAVMLMTALVSSQAHAGIVITTTNGGSFTYDPDGSMNGGNDDFIVGGGLGGTGFDGLNDLAIYLGYRTAGVGSTPVGTPIELNAISTSSSTDNTGTITFDQIAFDNGVTVDAVANFRIVDQTGAVNVGDGPSANVLYDLELTTGNVAGNEGVLQSLVGFDFNDFPANSDRIQGAEVISGFGTSQVSIGDINGPVERVLSGDFNFDAVDAALGPVSADAQNTDAFNGLIANNFDRFTNGATPAFTNADGDIGFSAFDDFGQASGNDVFNTAGVIGFRSTVAANVVPEPSAMLMASMGLGMVAFRRRRKQTA